MENEKSYPGCALSDGLPNGKVGGHIIVSDHSVRFRTDKDVLELPLQDLKIRRGGSSGHLVFLEHDARPGVSFYTEKKSILRHLKQLSRSDISQQVSGIRKSRMKLRAVILVVLAVIGLTAYGLYLLRTPIGKVIASNIPAEWEQSLGEAVFEQYKTGRLIIDEPGLSRTLESFTAPLMDSIQNKRYDFHITIISDPTVNAFALPGGVVVLHTGLILKAQSAEEVMGVLAHEIAHVTQQHGIRKMIDSLGFFILLKAIFGSSGGMLAEITEGGAFLLDQQFSRSFEREADDHGFAYLSAANINPSGMIDFFRRMNDESQKEGSLSLNNALNFLSTHPAPKERMQYLQQKFQKLNRRGGYLVFESNFKQFQQSIKDIQPTEPHH